MKSSIDIKLTLENSEFITELADAITQKVIDAFSEKFNFNAQNNQDDIIYSRLEFLQSYNLSSTTLHNLVRYSNFPIIKRGRKVFISKRDADEYFIKENKN